MYRVGKKGEDSHKATTEFDVTDKDITPMGGFPRYGIVKEDYIMIKASLQAAADPSWELAGCVCMVSIVAPADCPPACTSTVLESTAV